MTEPLAQSHPATLVPNSPSLQPHVVTEHPSGHVGSLSGCSERRLALSNIPLSLTLAWFFFTLHP